MYSMVLMAALTTSTDLPDWGRRGWGCCGCYGGYAWGGWGGCYGGWGGCFGGWGGCYGGWGGCYGWGGCGGYVRGGWGGWGGYSGWGGMGAFVSGSPVISNSPVLASNNSSVSSPTTYARDPDANRRARIVVHLPADAKLSVNGKAMRSTSATRRFVSPPLKVGEDYQYVFKAEVQRDGEPATIAKRVDVRAGQSQEITLRFNDREQSAQRKPAPARPAERKNLSDKSVRAGQS